MEEFSAVGIFTFEVNKGRKFITDHFLKIFGLPLVFAIILILLTVGLTAWLVIAVAFGAFGICEIHNKKNAWKITIDFVTKTVTFFPHRTAAPICVAFEEINKIYWNNYLLFYTNHGKIFFKDTTDKRSIFCASAIRPLTWGVFSFLGNIIRQEVEAMSAKQKQI